MHMQMTMGCNIFCNKYANTYMCDLLLAQETFVERAALGSVIFFYTSCFQNKMYGKISFSIV